MNSSSPDLSLGSFTPASVADALVSGVQTHLETLADRYFPGFQLPGFLNGQRVTTMDAADLAYDLAWLAKLGVQDLGGLPIIEAARRALQRVDGPRTDSFYSYRAAETLLAFGPTFADNPLLEGLSEAERENLRVATDSSAIFNPETGELPGLPNNYWAVLARCELRRQQLGLLPDPALLERAQARTAELLFVNPAGFFDDGRGGGGRFDIYSTDVHLFCEPMWPGLDPARLRANLAVHVELLEDAALENGAFVAWGRSIGAMSVCLTMELAAAALRLGLAREPSRMLGLVEHARRRFFADWLDAEDGLITGHRLGRNTEWYRGPYRQLQMTLDCLGKLLYTAEQLRRVAPEVVPAEPFAGSLFPAVDRFVAFTDDPARPAGVWLFRNQQLTFQLALVGGSSSDYAPTPRMPGLFETPVDAALWCALPRVLTVDGQEFVPLGVPAAVEKIPDGLRVAYEGFAGPKKDEFNVLGEKRLDARREAVCRVVEGDTLAVEERWTFAETPQAVTWHLPEPVDRPLHLETDELPAGAHVSTTNLAGMIPWRSAWGEAGRLHQVNFAPAAEIRFAYRVRPVPRVALTSAWHDYMRSLYDPMPSGGVVERPFAALPLEPDALAAALDGCDVLHLHWPEWNFQLPLGVDEAEQDRRLFQALDTLGRLPVRVVWTMHNRRPHTSMSPERGREFYRRVAAITDGVIHHSHWGMELMRRELPFRPETLHTVIAHGHFGAMNPAPAGATRAEWEAKFGLPPCETRFAVIGRPQKEKQADLIIRAFRAGARPGQQLFVTAATPELLEAAGDDPRVIVQPREVWLAREVIAAQLHVCDVIVNAVTGDSYLTSGASADTIGSGLGMVAPDWGYFRETLGDAAFYHDNTEAGLASVFARLDPAQVALGRARMAALRPKFEWAGLAEATARFMRGLPRKAIKLA